MRASLPLWLVLSSTPSFNPTVNALPSISNLFIEQPRQQPLQPGAHRSSWRKISDTLIDSIFPSPKPASIKSTTTSTQPDHSTPAHILARYGGDVVLRFNISTSEEAKSLAEAAETLLLDVWEFNSNWVDIHLSMDVVSPLLGLLPSSLQHAHTPLLRERELAQAVYDTYPTASVGAQHDAQHTTPVEGHRAFGPAVGSSNEQGKNIFFSNYQPLSVIEPWMRLMASLFASHVRYVTIGSSGQGREIYGLRVGVHPTNSEVDPPPKRRTVLVLGGIHAREWISTSTVTYLAYSLITGYGKSEKITLLLQEFDFVFVPTINPDGYAYTWDTDRLWRKNRQATAIRFCQGIDIDRSFGFEWDGLATALSSPCSESFAGETPFQAVEARQLSDWALNETKSNGVEFVGFLDLHSYSQQILYPYSFSCDAQPPGLENLEELAYGLQKAIRNTHGHVYEVLPACEGNVVLDRSSADGKPERLRPRMEASGGSALDWFYHNLDVHYSYQIKLPDRGSYGFLLPKENIIPTGKEMLNALLGFGDFLSSKYSTDKVKT